MPLKEKKCIIEYKAELEKLGITEDIAEMLILSQPFKEKFEAGKKEGIEQGVEQGIEKGTATDQIKVIENMLSKKCDWKFISEITGLSRQKYQSLKKKHS